MPLDQPPPVEIVVQAARLPDAAGDPAFSFVKIDPEVLTTADRLDDARTAYSLRLNSVQIVPFAQSSR